MNKLLPWLLKFDGYPPGVLLAVLLHGFLMYLFLPDKFEPADMVSIQPASFVVASAVKQSPQQLRQIQQLQRGQQSDEAERQRQRQATAEQQRQAEADRQRQADAEKQRQTDAERQRQTAAEQQRQAETERQRQAETERQRQAEAERQQQAAAESQRQADIQAANNLQNMSVENQLVAQYYAIINDLISRSWTRPPDARNGMTAVVQLRLTPTGEIISREIIQPSTSATFDRSVLQAVDRVGSFPELKDMPTTVFERNFRTFNLVFSPEDLLR